MEITAKTLQGGSLQAVMAACMLEDDAARKRFTAACKPPDDELLVAWAKHHGWTPARELAEWSGVVPGYATLFEEISDVWMLRGDLDVEKPPPIDKLVNTRDGLITLLTGLVYFGDDPSGDRCFVSTLPHPRDVAEVLVFDHETGELDGATYDSLAGFVYACWGEPAKQVIKAFKAEMAAARARRPVQADPKALFDRMKWLWSLPTGEPGYRFAEDMARAPTFATWEAEKGLAAESPVLASYWVLAHYFLGNTTACAEAIALAKRAPGAQATALAGLVAELLAKPTRAKLGRLGPKVLAELRAAVAKNADEALLEPALRAAVAKARAGTGAKADPKELKQRLAAGEDGWALIAAFPDDVAAHDLILAELAKGDAKLAAVVKRYAKQRAEDDIWDAWPAAWESKKEAAFDVRLAPAIGAAFRAGLVFDADHKKAAASLVNTLAYLDDDAAMDAFAAAIEACRMDDERLEYVVKALRASKHPRAQDVLARAAWRCFEFFDATKKSQKKTAKEGPTLANMFRTHSHLLAALVARIRIGDDEAEKLVDRVCSITQDMRVLGVAYAAAFAVVGDRGLERHVGLAKAYVQGTLALGGEHLSGEARYILPEAALCLARLRPAEAEALLRPTLTATTGTRAMRLDKIGGALAGLLFLAPTDPAVLAWTERILGSRTGSERAYGALRGVAAGKVAAARDWVRWHVYAGCSSNHIGEKPAIHRAARAALVALGEPEPPPFDESDEFAHERDDADLPAALSEHHRHLTDWVFKRIVERKLRSPEVVRAAGAVLHELYRFSADDEDRSSVDGRKEGLACLIFQGPPALPVLASLLALPDMAGSDKTVVLYVMTIIASAPARFAQLAAAAPDEVLAALAPSPEHIGTLDLAAGWALATLGERAHAAIEAAFRWRFAMVEPGSDHWIADEPTAVRLARIAAQLPSGPALLATLEAIEHYHLEDVIEAAREAPAAVTGMDGQGERTLQQHLKGGSGPKYACTIRIAGAEVVLEYAASDIYVQGILADNKYAQRGTIAAGSADAARTIADRVCQALGAIGFGPAPAKAAGKKKR